MDKTWMALTDKLDDSYILGVDSFLNFAYKNRDESSKIPCPCKCCNNYREQIRGIVENHLLVNGIRSTYSTWIYHGEKNGADCSDDEEMSDDGNFDNIDEELENMVNDIGIGQWGANWKEGSLDVNDEDDDVDRELESFMRLLDKAKEKLHSGCEYTILSFIVTLLHLKTTSGWSVKSFNVLLAIFRKFLPKEACIPKSFYEAKKLIKDLGFTYEKIHACVNDCVLYRKDHKYKTTCPKCKEPRYTSLESKVPRKVLRYFPLKPRLRRLFINKDIAENMRWHKEKRVEESGVMRHPADGEAWKHFNRVYREFAKDSRNVRLGLATDGFNPFDNLSTSYSIWPVFLVPYNLPPWKCMKDEFSIMSMLIPGPKSPGNAIDVYLQPLIDELKELWIGVPAYDAYQNAKFTLRASLIWTISDFPAYAMLSGWSTKGYYACPVCLKETTCQYLPCSRKLCYMGHRRFLDSNDDSRGDAHSFDGHTDYRDPVFPKSGHEILGDLHNLNLDGVSLGKLDEQARQRKRKRGDIEANWRKISVFFQLPYWPNLILRHNLDIMHIVKNVAESFFGTMMNIPGKTKDTWKSRKDLMLMSLKPELHLKTNVKGTDMPLACYQFTKDEKIKVVNFLSTVKYPDGFASNITRCVKDEEFQMSNMKSHDFYILLQKLLPIAVQGSLMKDARQIILGISSFVQKLCSKTSLTHVLEEEEKNIAKILCKMETLFPHSFFDIMVHLLVHLPHEAKLGGPPQCRWMFPFERKMGDVKPYVTNMAHPEGCIAERYIDKECTNFCAMYLREMESKFNRAERNGSRLEPEGELSVFSGTGRPFGVSKYETMSSSDLAKVHAYVLNNCDEIEDYICEHKQKLLGEGCAQIDEAHDKQFPTWFRTRISGSNSYPDELRALALGPDNRITRYTGCFINGFRFHTQSREKDRKTQNSGLLVKGEHEQNLIDFLGVVQDIIEVEYLVGKKKVLLFKCDWWNTGDISGMKVNPENGLKSLNFDQKWYGDQPYILAYQAQQVFYLKDLQLGNNWHVVQNCSARSTYDVPVRVDVSRNDVYQEVEPDMMLFVDLGIEMSSSLSRENESLEVIDPSIVNGSSNLQVDDEFLHDQENQSDGSSEDIYDEELWDMDGTDSE